jgi:hypothetical protein
MTYSAVARNTKIESIVFHTISFRVVPFARDTNTTPLATRVLLAEAVNSMITLTFDTWEEYDNAISSITTLTIAINEKENN